VLVRAELYASVPLQTVMTSIRKHIFLLIGLAALLYFILVGDLTGRQPTAIDVTIFFIGFVSMAVYVVQSFRRTREALKEKKVTQDGRRP